MGTIPSMPFSDAHSPTSVISSATSPVPAESPITVPSSPSSPVDVGATSAKIKTLENLIAQCGDSCVEEKQMLGDKVALLKKSITRSKPLTTQLETCRQAVERATWRERDARLAMESASAAWNQKES